jgi:predicted regulator of Ras-like GTPase activity (Roadblock/LC7/MglB family)
MFTFLKTLFHKQPNGAPAEVALSHQPAPPVRAAARTTPSPDGAGAVPQVAVARLSLLAILQRLPADLQANVAKFPDESVTIALPLTSIQKQLAAGSVKMSLASLYRQAPHGTFKSAKVEEKRMIEVPLSEAMKHLQPHAFRRRADQRKVDLPKNAPGLFGDRKNPFALAPSEEEEETPAHGSQANGHAPADEEPMDEEIPQQMFARPLKMPMAVDAAPAVAAPETPNTEGEVSLPLARLVAGWPEPVRAEAAAMGEAMVVVPAALLSPGMAKGKVAFSWRQIRGWISPAPDGATAGDEATEIALPLKVVAPAFIAHTRAKAAAPRKEVDLDHSIPGLFDGGEAARPATPSAPEPEPAAPLQAPQDPDVSSSPVELPSFRLATGAPVVEETEPEATMDIELPPRVGLAAPVEEPAHEETLSLTLDPKPAPEPAAVAPVATKQRSPQAMIDSIVALPGVSGAIVALREGLVVAAKLPETIKDDTIAAFLPQIFARLNNYTQEMQLGEVEDLLLTVNGAHFQSYHMGDLYFAVLGKAGEALPWAELQAVVQELQKQTVA